MRHYDQCSCKWTEVKKSAYDAVSVYRESTRLDEIGPLCAAFNAGFLEGRLDHETRAQNSAAQAVGYEFAPAPSTVEAAKNLVGVAREILGQ